jgi:AcrR family transcriptional regulator
MGKSNPFEGRDVQSRRGGPVKEPLSRDRIVAEALRLLAHEGKDGMSLRKVAAALETGPASLYAYVDDLQALEALVLDRALAAVDVSGARRRGWRDRVKAVLESYVRTLIASPGLAALALSTIAVGPHALRIVDSLLGLLEEGGIDRTTAAWSVDLLLLYAAAIASEQSHGHDAGNPEGPLARAIANVSADEFPNVHAGRDHLLSGEGEERFVWAIDVLTSGMLACPAPRPTARKRAQGSRRR